MCDSVCLVQGDRHLEQCCSCTPVPIAEEAQGGRHIEGGVDIDSDPELPSIAVFTFFSD